VSSPRGIDVTDRPSGSPSVRLGVASDVLARFCEIHHIARLSLFGSVLAGTERPDSDVDLLVEFEPGRVPGMLALAGMEAELSTLLGGRRVDLRTAADLSRYFRDEVVRAAELQHAR
jgi:predicted nucleotidyltransferase